jgi:hypothetical protein
MAITFYLLRAKDSAVGDGAYLGTDADGKPSMVPSNVEARRFPTLDAAERAATEHGEQFGGFEIEIRNSDGN